MVEIKKHGANYTGLCPFHNEKTGSFHVSPSRGIYKCFGCGAAGDSIRFVQDYKRLDFIDAIKWLANFYNIPVEEEKNPQVSKEQHDEKLRMYEVNELAAKMFHAHFLELPEDHPAKRELMETRGFTLETITDFRIGFAPDGWRFLTDPFAKSGMLDIGYKLGLIRRKESDAGDRNYDFFRNRIMFPIYNTHGQVVGFGGRLVNSEQSMVNSKESEAAFSPSPSGEGRDEVKLPKYLNSPESPIYNKSQILYGLNLATGAIRTNKEAILVEGYMDVIAMHQSHLSWTVGVCGTSFTQDQAKLLKKHCSKVIRMSDGDPAGIKSNFKSVDVLLAEGFKVDICPLPSGEDPDSLVRQLELEVIMN